jgi:chromosome partitioning protein
VGRTIACANQKGGVGKTTTVLNVATYLALDGHQVLIVDLDPQGNATSGLGVDRAPLDRSIYDGLIDGASLESLTVGTTVPGLHLVPSTVGLAGAEVELTSVIGRERRLTRLIGDLDRSFDVVFVDCPPSLGLLTVNALAAADGVLIPLQAEFYALEGLTQLMGTIGLVRDHLHPALEVDGVVLTMYDSRTNLSAQVAAEARRHLGDRVFQTVIPRSVRLSEAPSHGLPIAWYAPSSRGAEAYRALASEVSTRLLGPARSGGTPDGTNTHDPAPDSASATRAGSASSAGAYVGVDA